MTVSMNDMLHAVAVRIADDIGSNRRSTTAEAARRKIIKAIVPHLWEVLNMGMEQTILAADSHMREVRKSR